MKSYNTAERTLARLLDAMPAARRLAKFCYQRANYLVFRERGFRTAIHPDVRMVSLEETTGKSASGAGRFFGYYDKTPWAPDLRYVLAHAPLQDGTVAVEVHDLETRTVQTLGVSAAWNWQQGSMLQWLPNPKERHVVWNDIIDGKLGSRIVSLSGGEARTIPWPVQTLHPNGREALTLNYKRLDRIRPEYGYSAAVENFSADLPAKQDGLWHVDLSTGQGKLSLSLADLQANQPRLEMADSLHKVNHMM